MQTTTSDAANAKNKLTALEQQLEAVRRERANSAHQQGAMTELRSKSAALEQALETLKQKDLEIVTLRRRLETASATPPGMHSPVNNNNHAEVMQLRAANAELTLRLSESEAVQEQLQAMLRKTATQLKAAVSSVRCCYFNGSKRALLFHSLSFGKAEEHERLQDALDEAMRLLAIERNNCMKLEAQLKARGRV